LLLQGIADQQSFNVAIIDFGKGFDIDLLEKDGHYGLKNMKQRAESINATLQISSTDGKGVAVKIIV
jgi:signal transduction histidine kinase